MSQEIRFCPKCKSENVRPSTFPRVSEINPSLSWECVNCGYQNDIFPIKVKESFTTFKNKKQV
jgi:Zn ribbon nucleic-acid-binding protein